MEEAPMMKTCGQCGVEKALTPEFYGVQTASADGFRAICRVCFSDNRSAEKMRDVKNLKNHDRIVKAAKKALELLSAKELADGQQYFGLYLQQLQQRVKALKALNEPLIGDGLTKSDTDQTFWLAALMPKGPKLDMANLKQQAAMPLSSFLRFDPWTDQLITLHTAYEPLLTAADKMPFEVEPVYLKLSYYKAPAEPAAAPAAAAPAAAPAADTGTPSPEPGTSAPLGSHP